MPAGIAGYGAICDWTGLGCSSGVLYDNGCVGEIKVLACVRIDVFLGGMSNEWGQNKLGEHSTQCNY